MRSPEKSLSGGGLRFMKGTDQVWLSGIHAPASFWGTPPTHLLCSALEGDPGIQLKTLALQGASANQMFPLGLE